LIGVAAGGRSEACSIEEAQPIAADSGDDPLRFQDPEDTTGHLAARADEARKVGAREYRLLGEEQVRVSPELPGDTSQGILTVHAVQAQHDALVPLDDVPEDVASETGVSPGEGLDLLRAPHGRPTRRQRQRLCGGWACTERQDRSQLAVRDDHRDQMPPVVGGAAPGDVTLEYERDRPLISLVQDRLAGSERADTSPVGKGLSGVDADMREYPADRVRQSRGPG
jgi:hypothetical protein